MSKQVYITTAIDYVNSLPHIGTAYEKIGADVLARFKRLDGYQVLFQMGNDEHSVNVKKAADKAGIHPKKYCDQMLLEFEKIWQELNISYDGFIQTSDPHHEQGVQKLFAIIADKGDIYSAHYEGWYCESCEAFLTDKDLVEGKCPNHKSKPKWLQEENYFFALSKYRDRLLKHIQDNPEFIQPEVRRNEVLSLLNQGLDDISVSRASFPWGIPLPNDPSHVVYVWFDALINYITAIGYGWDEKKFKKWWPAQVHVIGKDITRFHCVIWPAMLLSAGLKLPKTIFAHGFVSLRGEKMSKTLGNVVTPLDVCEKYGADPLRYYLLREGAFGRDSDFTWENFIRRYNGDLANELGNLVSRTIGMARRYFEGKVSLPAEKLIGERELELKTEMVSLLPKLRQYLDYSKGEVNFHHALALLWEAMAKADRYISDLKPWALAKEKKLDQVNCILYHLLESLRILTILLQAFIPQTAEKIWQLLGLDFLGELAQQDFTKIEKWGGIKSEVFVKETTALFPRIEEKESEEKGKKMESNFMEQIEITDFAKVDLRVAEVVQAEKVEGADKLLKLKINLGQEERQIVAGIAQHYSPEEMVGKKVVVVANLKPAKLRGIESQGMLLAASDAETISVLTPVKDVKIGSKVK
ncbi:MAG: methionine--tRNA ligase [Pseudomonadota bacterium]